MLCLTTTRIILGFICFGPIRFTGRSGYQQLFSATPCFDQNHTRLQINLDAHQTARVYYALITVGAVPLSFLVLKDPMVLHRSRLLDDTGELWWTPPLLSSLSVSSPSPPIPKGTSGRLFWNHTHIFTCWTMGRKVPVVIWWTRSIDCVWYKHVEYLHVKWMIECNILTDYFITLILKELSL